MDLKELGRSGIRVPSIGMGTWGIGGYSTRDVSLDKESVFALRRGIELGMTLIDTAEIYGDGHAEEIIGEAIKVFPREKVFIVSKVWYTNLHYDDVIAAAKKSLERLQTGWIDLYLVHAPNPWTPLRETMAAMEKLIEMGFVKFIGLSNFDVRLMKEAQLYLSKADIMVNQVLYSLGNRSAERDIVPYCLKERITVMAYTPLDKGALSKNKFLRDIGRKYNRTPVQVALNWLIAKENVIAIPKAIKIRHLEENAGAMGWRLSSEDILSISFHFS